ncbi:putative structural maintenance [Paragonimus heterotremus]|uniref:Structural maintenance of chromosomes protein n=1 Tax=Paragonimus heterotremus TaxID=100268 RepID=A0A8J4TI17_9TREM|nr:putative structural maintenance [Paragonimus heterotremus]
MAEACGRLKYIELENYKSYKGKQVIGPFSTFTAIIGPNGSGKSNLMDAISFVLGENTRHLRVRRLNDLIHGSVVGKPVSKSASVTAVYEMPDGEEIRYSRVIHGNTSEYRINGASVRVDEYAAALEKIHIFMKVKNFLVFQGAVESIAMKNARERCQMFEEISKYAGLDFCYELSRSAELKEEYDIAKMEMHKLEENTTFNLNKKKGIVAERKEAKIEIDEAEKYRKLQQDLTSKRIELHLFKLYYNDLEIRRVREEMRQREEIIATEHEQRQAIEEEMKDKRRELGKINRDQSTIEQEIKKCEQKIGKRRPEFIKVSQLLRHVTEKHKESKKSLENAKQLHSSHLQEIDQLEAEQKKIALLKLEYEQQQTKKSLEQGINLELEETQLTEYHRLKQKVAERTSHLSAVLDGLNREYNEQKDLYDALDRRKNEIESSLKRKETELNENKKRLQKLTEYIDSSNRAITEQRETERAIREEVEEATRRIDEINSELEAVVCQLGEAKVERHESSRAAKKQELIENLKRLFPGVHGRLLEMCQPSHRRYQVAITKVLGKYMDAIVCDSEKTAKECIQYMKDQRIEPETFLPLDFLDVKPIDERLREISDPPNVHLVIDVIQCDPIIVKKALTFACGNALVCETVEHARYVAYQMGERKKTVSLEGTLFQRSGVISGGASDLKARARRWDEKQISTLMSKRDALQTELKEQLKRKRKEAELRTIQSQIKGLETRLKYTLKDKDSTEEKLLSTNEEEMAQIGRELEEVEERLGRCQTKMQELQISVNAEKAKMDTVEDTVFRDFCVQIGVENIRQYEDRELRVARERDRKRLEFTNQLQRFNNQLDYERSRDTEANVKRWEEAVLAEKVEIEKCKKQEKKIKEEMEQEENRKNELESRIADLKGRAEALDTELTEIRRRLVTKQRDLQKQQKEFNQAEARLESRRAERHSLLQSAKMDDLELPLKPGASPITELESQLSTDAENADPSTEEMARIYELEARLPIDFKRLEKPLRQLSEEKDISRRSEEMQNHIDSMLNSLARIQAPNLRAGDKLGNVEERLRSTEAEFEDTRRRAKRAKARFERVRRLRYNAFMNCFLSITDNIDPIYKSLSRNPGAQASLLPTNAEEPYLEEIQFQCVAPGKRFQQMDSLSGGEKTIAALALLFAMHRYNPSPFFVLDEIDAALDNTNIGKVASFIREYASARAQIIVISLKEEFYSRADSLIGIYPDIENNCLVSHVLSFDLSKYVDTVCTRGPLVTSAHLLQRVERSLVTCHDNLKTQSLQLNTADRLLLGSQTSSSHLRATVLLYGDLIYEAELKAIRPNASSYYAVIKDGMGSPYKLQQIQDCHNFATKSLNTLRSALETASAEELSTNRRFLLELLRAIRDAINSLTQPPRKTVEEHMTNPCRKCFHPPVPKDVVLSFFLRGPVLVFASYALVYNGQDRRWEIVGRMSVDSVVPRLQEVLYSLHVALDTTSHLIDRLGAPA